jgi:peroxiredoxin
MKRHMGPSVTGVGLVISVGLVALSWSGTAVAIASEREGEAGSSEVGKIALTQTDGEQVSLGDFLDKKALVVVFIGTECPVNNAYMRPLKEMQEEFARQDVRFVAINSNPHDSADAVVEHARQHRLPFPVLRDLDHLAADALDVERTPEAFLLDAKGEVHYRGRIDDQFGVGFQRPKPTRRDLGIALQELIDGKPVSVARTQATGCRIGRSKKTREVTDITYSNQIARLLQNRCEECHRAGRVGPFSLDSYEKAKGWADMIREVVTDGRMPPWHADPRYGKFSNDRRLTQEERETLLAWIDQGCSKGDDKDLPPPRQYTEGWTIGEPDVVLTMEKPFTVPAKAPKGGVPYQHIVVPTHFEEDRWVQAAEARPGNRAVVHHILTFIQQAEKPLAAQDDNILVGHAPGDLPLVLPPGVAMKIPKGAKLIFQMHYTANGVEQSDRSSVGLIFAKEPPKHAAHTRTVNNLEFVIPPGAANHQVRSGFTFPKDAVVLSFMPHMHLRGKRFQYEVVYPDGRCEIVLSVPRYDFNWQSTYRLATPLRIPAGTRLECTGTFDNSADNPNNPDPTQQVRWGDQTWEEMMGGLLDYYFVDEGKE